MTPTTMTLSAVAWLSKWEGVATMEGSVGGECRGDKGEGGGGDVDGGADGRNGKDDGKDTGYFGYVIC